MKPGTPLLLTVMLLCTTSAEAGLFKRPKREPVIVERALELDHSDRDRPLRCWSPTQALAKIRI